MKEALIKKYGEQHRKLIEDALNWIEPEPWGLPTPMNKEAFIANLIDRVSNGQINTEEHEGVPNGSW